MSDPIERQDVIDLLSGVYHYMGNWLIQYIEDGISSIPSAQPEIIACGDCKHWIRHDRRCGYWNHGVKPLEWCSHAERREDER